jgi:hypothetical protein
MQHATCIIFFDLMSLLHRVSTRVESTCSIESLVESHSCEVFEHFRKAIELTVYLIIITTYFGFCLYQMTQRHYDL